MIIPVSLLVAHVVGDFFLQSNWMAVGKSKLGWALLAHVGVYSLCFSWLGWEFVLVTGALHGATDAITSQFTKRWWYVELVPTVPIKDQGLVMYPFYARIDDMKRFLFWRMIGLDQLIHFVALAYTYQYFFGE